MNVTKDNKSKLKTLLPICKCGHGKVFHNGTYGECIADIGYFKNEEICRCPTYEIDINHESNKRIREWNDELNILGTKTSDEK